MPKLRTGFNANSIKHHFDYMGWAYFVLPLVMILSWSLIYTFSAPRTPENKLLSLYIVGNMVSYDRVEALQREIEPGFEDMEEFDFMSIELNNIYEYDNWQRFSTYLYAQQGDVYIMDRALFQNLAVQGTFMPLDGLFALGGEFDLTNGYAQAEEDDAPRLYGIPADTLYGLRETEWYDNRDTVICVTAFTGNPGSSLRLIDWLIKNRTAPQPDYFDQLAPKEPFYPEGFFDDIEGFEAQ